MTTSKSYRQQQIEDLRREIATNQRNLQRQGEVSGFNQLASRTSMLEVQLASWLKPAPKSNRAAPKSGSALKKAL